MKGRERMAPADVPTHSRFPKAPSAEMFKVKLRPLGPREGRRRVKKDNIKKELS